MELRIHAAVTSPSFHWDSQKNNFGFTVAYHNEKLLNHWKGKCSGSIIFIVPHVI